MIESFKVDNYRGFKNFELSQLGRINLLVGENNSGKTSILEIIKLCISYPYFPSLLDIFNHRGEFSWIDLGSFSVENDFLRRMEKKFNIFNIFNYYSPNDNNSIKAIFTINSNVYNLNILINQNPDYPEIDTDIKKLDRTIIFDNLCLSFLWSKNEQKSVKLIEIPTNIKGEITSSDIQKYLSKKNFIYQFDSNINNVLINPFYDDISNLINTFDQISLTPLEEIVIEAIKIIEPKIKRIATTKSDKAEKNSLKVLLDGYSEPISVASMGEGIWQLLKIILAMVNTKNGVLFIDEIDTGLHFTTLLKMWELILETSKKLNIQVFATTHNSDCWMALGELITQKNTKENPHYIRENEITLHRIEVDKKASILFNTNEISIAANREIEVR
ncbi:AAA family ATPase [Geminocystis sp. CENA526]|uniref:AAA family ATPase n=1 Tax=Geminocystis sp. CENA526 TaxID=1355871 RepID=UPI003D6F04E8